MQPVMAAGGGDRRLHSSTLRRISLDVFSGADRIAHRPSANGLLEPGQTIDDRDLGFGDCNYPATVAWTGLSEGQTNEPLVRLPDDHFHKGLRVSQMGWHLREGLRVNGCLHGSRVHDAVGKAQERWPPKRRNVGLVREVPRSVVDSGRINAGRAPPVLSPLWARSWARGRLSAGGA
jgi:hypothetical protein